MKIKSSPARKAFVVINYVILTLVMCLSLFPLIHIFALSLSSNSAAQAGWVTILPVNFTLDSYEYILRKPEFFKSFGVSLLRVVLGTVISVGLTIVSAYAMSQPDERFHARKYYVWVFLVTMVFSGGLIPLFIVVKSVGIYNSIWALVLPGAVQTFNVILMLNFFRGLPYALTESALIDGANHFRIMAKIVVPISKPSLATVGLFTMVNHWNSWFDGMIYLSDTAKYPMQTYLRNVINSVDAASLDLNSVGAMTNVSQKTVTAAQIFVAIIPILLVYPFLQKYFISGMTLGSVKE
nr:carbohydrate ABC transporter permease [uncultured Acetatifactor sp.]